MRQDIETRINRVQEAARAGLARRMQEHEDKIINRLVSAYRSGTLTSEMLFAGIGSVAELRSVAYEAEHDLMMAAQDSENITAGAQNA